VIQDKKRIAYLGKRKPKNGKLMKGNKKRGGAGQKLAPAAASPKEPPLALVFKPKREQQIIKSGAILRLIKKWKYHS